MSHLALTIVIREQMLFDPERMSRKWRLLERKEREEREERQEADGVAEPFMKPKAASPSVFRRVVFIIAKIVPILRTQLCVI